MLRTKRKSCVLKIPVNKLLITSIGNCYRDVVVFTKSCEENENEKRMNEEGYQDAKNLKRTRSSICYFRARDFENGIYKSRLVRNPNFRRKKHAYLQCVPSPHRLEKKEKKDYYHLTKAEEVTKSTHLELE